MWDNCVKYYLQRATLFFYFFFYQWDFFNYEHSSPFRLRANIMLMFIQLTFIGVYLIFYIEYINVIYQLHMWLQCLLTTLYDIVEFQLFGDFALYAIDNIVE